MPYQATPGGPRGATLGRARFSETFCSNNFSESCSSAWCRPAAFGCSQHHSASAQRHICKQILPGFTPGKHTGMFVYKVCECMLMHFERYICLRHCCRRYGKHGNKIWPFRHHGCWIKLWKRCSETHCLLSWIRQTKYIYGVVTLAPRGLQQQCRRGGNTRL